MLSACRWAEVFPSRPYAPGRIFRPWSRPRLKRPSFRGIGCSARPAPGGFQAFRPLFCGRGAAGFKKNRPPVQRVRLKTEKISTEGLEVCYKSFYLCTTPQGRAGCSGKSSHERKKGSTVAERGNRKKKAKKNFRKFLEVRKRFLPLQSRRKRRRNKKR